MAVVGCESIWKHSFILFRLINGQYYRDEVLLVFEAVLKDRFASALHQFRGDKLNLMAIQIFFRKLLGYVNLTRKQLKTK